MTTSQETINDAARRGQTAFANALRVWADGVGMFVGSTSAPNAKASTAEEVMDNFFNFAAQALATQREFVYSHRWRVGDAGQFYTLHLRQ